MRFRSDVPFLARASIALAWFLAVSAASGADPGRAVAAAPTGTLTLAAAAQAALAHSPELAAASWDLRAEDARTIQAGLLPNPELRFQAEDFGGSGSRPGFEQTETTLSLAQLVELGGKRARRRELAHLGRELADWSLAVTRVDLLARVTRAFVGVLAAQERLALTTQLLTLARESEHASARLVAAGATSPTDRLRADVVVSRMESERAVRARELETGRAVLAATWGASSITFTDVQGNLEAITAPPALDTLAARLDDAPQIARFRTQLAREQAALAVERARRIPDLTLRLGGRRFEDDGSMAMVSELAIPLPVFDRNQGGIAEAQAHLGRVEAQRRAAEVTSRAALSAAWQDLAAAFEEATSLQTRVLPVAQAALAQTRAAYGQGLLRSIDVLDAQRTLFELRADRVRALAAYHTAAAEVERLTGVPLARAGEEH